MLFITFHCSEANDVTVNNPKIVMLLEQRLEPIIAGTSGVSSSPFFFAVMKIQSDVWLRLRAGALGNRST